VGFVVEELPFGGLIVFERAVLVVGHGKGFRAGAQKKVFGAGCPNVDGTFPDDFSDISGFSDVGIGFQRRTGGFAGGNRCRFVVKAFADGIYC